MKNRTAPYVQDNMIKQRCEPSLAGTDNKTTLLILAFSERKQINYFALGFRFPQRGTLLGSS